MQAAEIPSGLSARQYSVVGTAYWMAHNSDGSVQVVGSLAEGVELLVGRVRQLDVGLEQEADRAPKPDLEPVGRHGPAPLPGGLLRDQVLLGAAQLHICEPDRVIRVTTVSSITLQVKLQV